MSSLNGGRKYINDDLKKIERDLRPCVFIASGTGKAQPQGYEVDVECFQLVGQIERKSRLYTTDAEGRLQNRAPALLGVFPVGDADFDTAAWNWINSRFAKPLARQISKDRQSAPQSPIAVMPEKEQLALMKTGELTPPRLTQSKVPRFTDMARIEHIQGEVLIRGTVDTDGLFKEVRVLTPLGYGLDEEALKAIDTYRFLPARLRGAAVPAVINIEVNFHIYP